ncbi:NAD(P)-binding protein [Wilcoxina mikolae CBS 423.85]|nr:NAD(P)-binding protein [Wilcoxina mikolae CBS 423.85]
MSSHQDVLPRLEMLKFAFDNPSTISLNPYGPLPFFIRNVFYRTPATYSTASILSKRVLITGGNSGVGFEAAKKLLNDNANVIITSRSAARGEEARRKLKEATGRQCEVWELDMASFSSVQKLAERASEEGLDMCILNVGAYLEKFQRAEETGYEMTLQVHIYATCLLALLLIPVLAKSLAPRLLIVTSEAHAWMIPRERTADEFLTAMDTEAAYKTYHRYHLSKLAMQLWTQELAAWMSGQKVVVGTVTPGFCVTGLFTGSRGQWLSKIINVTLGRTAEHGARIYLKALTQDKEKVHGVFWSHGRPMQTCRWARSEAGVRFQTELWTTVKEKLTENTGIKEWHGIDA